MSVWASPFDKRTMLALVATGAAAFLLFLYALGAGWGASRDRNGGAHAAANGLNGYAALARLLEARGHAVSLSRDSARLDEPALLVITPQAFAEGEEIAQRLDARRTIGPTLLILPKWFAAPAENNPRLAAAPGWVILAGAAAPEWIEHVPGLEMAEAQLSVRRRWSGLGRRGALPEPDRSVAILKPPASQGATPPLQPLITDEHGDILAGLRRADESLWPLVIVAEPDLVNNYGLADSERARLAVALVETTLGGRDRPVVFDLTLAGLASSRNLLTLAFEPPLLAATLCLLLAAFVIAWRAARRFGPPVAEAPAIAAGKRQLARNGAALIERARRLHLLGPPYAALVGARVAARLGIRETDPASREAAIAATLSARGVPGDFAARTDALRRARRPQDLMRAAGALWTFERTLARNLERTVAS